MSSEPRNPHDDATPGPSTQRNENQEPIKGILKRPSIKQDQRDQVVPTITHRPSPDRFPDKPGTRIPKLSVTWWEKNAVAIFGDTSDENNTDSEQLFKDLGNGSTAQTEQERQTAIIDSEDDSEEVVLESQDLYEEPGSEEHRDDAMSVASTGSATSSVVGRWWTGKDTRFVPHCVKRGCKHNHGDLGEYLTPTQRRNKEISDLKGELRAALKERDDKERHLEELRERIKEVEVLNVKQASLSDSHRLMMRERETAEAYEREKKQMERRHAVRVNQLVQETLTARDEIVRLNARIKELEKADSVVRVDSETMTDSIQMTMSSPMLTSPLCVSVESKVTGQPMYLSQEALNHMQACQNEAFIWRTKAAQLEIVVKDQLAKANRVEEALRAEILALRTGQLPMTEEASTTTGPMVEDITGTPTRLSPIVFECNVPSCIEKKKELVEENNRLSEEVVEVNTRIHELEDDVNALRHDLDTVEEHRDRLKQHLEVATRERDSKIAEVAACNIVITRHQTEKDTMQKAIAYMEERMQVYQNTLMDHDLVELHDEVASSRSDLHGKFEEIERILLAKTQLVETLSKQLEDTCRDQRQQIDSHQEEREAYKKNLEEIATVAEKVPVLETRIEQLLKEKSEVDLRFSAQREEMEHALEEALTEALAKYKEQTEYWTSKHAALEQTLERSKLEIAKHIKEKEDMKMKAKLDRADLERRLTSSIDHVAQLNSQGDLFDENEERLKLCQGELATTRRQVHVLQQKLISIMQEKADKRLQVRRRITCVVDRDPPDTQKVDAEKLEALQTKNAELREQVTSDSHLTAAEEEKTVLVHNERERIRHLVNEFENVRRELDQEMNRYESEKTWLKSRIRNLETDNEELQRTIEGRGENASPASATPSIRKTLSEPELGNDDDLTARLRAENVALRRELDRVRDSIRRTTSAVSADRSHLSPAFATLAGDLNVVKSDLEQILNSMDCAVPSTCADELDHTSASPSLGRSPVNDEELLHSDVLETVMMSWRADEKKNLIRDLKRSRQERDVMKTRIERLSKELNEARAELEVYRREGVHERHVSVAREDTSGIVRSHSASNLVADLVNKDDVRMWKEKCGTMFRELNAMRSGYQRAQEERRELKIQLAMMRGELEMVRCQSERDADTSVESSVYFSPFTSRSRSQLTPSELRRGSRNSVIVHQNPEPFDRGSTRERVACRITATPQRVERGVISKQFVGFRRIEGFAAKLNPLDYSILAVLEKKSCSTRHSSLAFLKAALVQIWDEIGDDYLRRINMSPSLSSSITSLPNNHVADPEFNHQCQALSQSWHESSEQRNVFSAEPKDSPTRDPPRESHPPTVTRRETRTVSLREKVGQLSRENRLLQEQLAASNAAVVAANSATKTTFDVERLNRLEQEKDALRAQIELLLSKIQQETSSAGCALAEINSQLELCRQENSMYEKKLRDMEEERKEMYLVMFKKGQEAATMDLTEVAQVDQMTQDRVVLRFLHDAFYYYLMNKGDSKEHLQVQWNISRCRGFSS
ncbi:unnamed protein product [Nippostrongylus brasiliensis]|uniref:CAP-Gly domain-containing protein n=1 Tax=Nippostrongylus brasiliensis TaxID=27835 RepID=A0A158QX02_NIPBR|nr:unnamed protein product [Nippostrongylus brasiliensis]